MLVITSLCLGAVAGMAVTYLSLQYSVDLQKLVGLKGRYATISFELQHLQEKTANEDERVPLLNLETGPPAHIPAADDFDNVTVRTTTGPELQFVKEEREKQLETAA